MVEAFESFFHFDGRLFQTVPKLAIRPGRLTRDYLDGKRAYQIPPLRMFLIVILVLFFAAGVNMGATGKQAVNFNPVATPAQKAAADAASAKAAQSVKAALGAGEDPDRRQHRSRHQHQFRRRCKDRRFLPPFRDLVGGSTASW